METSTVEKINCLDLSEQHENLKQEIFKEFEKVYEKTAFSGGPFVAEFEKDFATYCNTKYAVGLNNGTNALHLALKVLNIKEGDEVIIPANTFIATAWAVSYVGAKPVFVDCLEDTWEIDPEKIEEAITAKTKAIIGVHLYGQPFDFNSVKAIADQHNLKLIEDAAQAHGAIYNEKKAGSLADLACFSFYPGKNLGACGEGGAITTNNEEYYNQLLKLRNHGCEIRYHHDELGYNMRMGGLEAVSLKVKLKYLDEWNKKRQAIAQSYFNNVKNPLITFQAQPENTKSVFHLFVVTVPEREKFIQYLNKNNIFPGLHYPIPCHLQKAYAYLGYKKGDLPHSEYLAEHCVSLPIYAEMTNPQVNHVVRIINNFK